MNPESQIGIHDTRRTVMVCACLCLGTLLVYWPVGQYDFVNYDDPENVTDNVYVKAGLTAPSIVWAFTTRENYWRPLTRLSHLVDVELFGLNPGMHHLVNVALHLANVVLLFLVLYRMTGRVWRCAVVAALFGLHPLHVESVAWVTERKDVLSTFFFLLTIWAYVSYVERPGVGRYVVVLAFFALGLMSKPVVAALPALLLLLDYWPLERLTHWSEGQTSVLQTHRGFNRPAASRSKAGPVWLLVEKIPMMTLALASVGVAYLDHLRAGVVAGNEVIAPSTRIVIGLVSYAGYIGRTIWPVDLAVVYPYPLNTPLWQAALAFGVLAGFTMLALRRLRTGPYLAVGWFWYVSTLLPSVALTQAGGMFMCDRNSYVPLVGLFIAIVWLACEFAGRLPYGKAVLVWLTAGTAFVCTLTASLQLRHWKDSVTLFQRAVSVTANNATAYHNLGSALAEQGRLEEAVKQYDEALRLRPDMAEGHLNLGIALLRRGDTNTAAAHFATTLRLKPDYADAHTNLGVILAAQRRLPEAIAHYEAALQSRPDRADSHYNLAIALATEGRTDDAIAQYREALRLKPEDADVHYNLARALDAQGRVQEAIPHYAEAVRARPDSADAHNNLGIALARAGQLADSVAHLSEATRLRPGDAGMHNNLAGVLMMQGQTTKAIEQYREALQLRTDWPEVLDALAAAYADAGRSDDAVQTARKASEIRGRLK